MAFKGLDELFAQLAVVAANLIAVEAADIESGGSRSMELQEKYDTYKKKRDVLLIQLGMQRVPDFLEILYEEFPVTSAAPLEEGQTVDDLFGALSALYAEGLILKALGKEIHDNVQKIESILMELYHRGIFQLLGLFLPDCGFPKGNPLN